MPVAAANATILSDNQLKRNAIWVSTEMLFWAVKRAVIDSLLPGAAVHDNPEA
jgi:hypothetical protein